MLPTIVTCFPLAKRQIEQIEESVSGQFNLLVSDQDKISKDLFAADIFCGHAKVPVDWPAVVQQGRLKWIQSSAAGLDHCLVPEVIESDILVSGCSGLFAPQVAEQTLALLMGLVRRMPVFFRAQSIKEFVRRPTDNLEGKRVLILGFGGNGQRIANVLRPMVGSIVATDCFQNSDHHLLKNGTIDSLLPAIDFESCLPEADVVIVTLPLSAANEQLLGEKQFRAIKPGAYLINVGRGSVVETGSLVASLRSGHLGGAGIDVVDPEPLPEDSPLWTMDNVIISPHVGAQSPRRVPATVDLLCKNIQRFIENETLLNLVNKPLGFPLPEHRIDFSHTHWSPSNQV